MPPLTIATIDVGRVRVSVGDPVSNHSEEWRWQQLLPAYCFMTRPSLYSPSLAYRCCIQ